MIKFILPAVLLLIIVLFWEKISEKIYKQFNIKINYIILLIFSLILVTIITLLYF